MCGIFGPHIMGGKRPCNKFLSYVLFGIANISIIFDNTIEIIVNN